MEVCIAYYPSPDLKDPYCILLCLKTATGLRDNSKRRHYIINYPQAWSFDWSKILEHAFFRAEKENKLQQQSKCLLVS